MELIDIVVYSESQSNKLYSILKTSFPANKFVLYKLNKQELLSKCWYNTFRILVIHTDSNSPREKDIDAIVIDNLRKRKQIIMISDTYKSEFFETISIDDMKAINLDDYITTIQSYNQTHLIGFLNLDVFCDKYNEIYKIWNLSQYSTTEILSHHSDVWVISRTKKCSLEYIISLKLHNISTEPSMFQYNGLDFAVNIDNCLADNIDAEYKLLSSTNKLNKNLAEISSFQKEKYFKSLYTQYLGRIVLFSEVLASSFDLMESFLQLGNFQPAVIISLVQTQGKGRGLNRWISPMGCAMFTFLLPISIKSKLAQLMSLVQHIVAVSIVEALNFICWIDESSLQIKWPNDIYWINRGKISGILMKSTMQDDYFYCSIGCGINVANREPSVCLYDIIDEKNEKEHKWQYPTIEEIIAHVLTRIESNIANIQNDENGIANFKKRYYKYWMHGNQQVTCQKSNGTFSGKIIGIDDFGYLQIISNDGIITAVHPDGNSFDMMHNLIVPK